MQITRDEATGTPVKIVLRKPFDGHQHLRQGAMLKRVAPMVAKRFAAAIIMPNTKPPITREHHLPAYWQEITNAAPGLTPLMTMYLTDTLYPSEVARCIANRTMVGVKYYPPGLTTNSESGVKDPQSLWAKGTKPYECLRALSADRGVLLVHGADAKASGTWKNEGRAYSKGDVLDPFDQEPHFVSQTLPCIRDTHPDLSISFEHLSSAQGVEYMRAEGGSTLGCSLTAQHLLLDRRDLFCKRGKAGFNPHQFWWPIIQSHEHTQELRRFAAEGHAFVCLGSDSAPHPIGNKENDCCSGGVLMAHAGIELYVEAFEDIGCLEKLEKFASVNGPAFYGFELGDETITLVREEWEVKPFMIANADPNPLLPGIDVIPFRLGETVRWKLAD